MKLDAEQNAAVRDRWITDTQTFQRLAGVSVAAAAELRTAWESMPHKLRLRAAEFAREHRIIQDMAIAAGKRAAE